MIRRIELKARVKGSRTIVEICRIHESPIIEFDNNIMYNVMCRLDLKIGARRIINEITVVPDMR